MEKNNQINLKGPLRQFLLFAILIVIIWACTTHAKDRTEPNANNATAVPKGTPVDAVVLKPSEISDVIDINATLVANQEVDIVSELTRKVIGVRVKEGSKVKRGTILFRLDDADLQAQLGKLRQQEKLAALNEQRLRDLLEHDAVAQQDYDEVSTSLKVLQAQIEELLVSIDKTRIIAPFDGQIGMIDIHPGSIVSTNTTLTNIEDTRIIKVEFSVPEKYASTVAVGNELSFVTSATGKKYTAKVSAISARLDANTRSLVVRAITSNDNTELFPGQSARVTLAFETSNESLAVPANALIPSSTGYSIFVARNAVAQAVPVQIGQRSAAAVQVLSGLQKGDTVITSNILRLGPGTPVSFASIK